MKILIDTTSKTLEQKTIQELMSQANIESESLFFFDFEEHDGLLDSIGEYLSSSFFEDKKMIILRNFTGMKNKTSKLEKEQEDLLTKLFNQETENIFVFLADKTNKDNKYFKEYQDKFSIFRLDVPAGKDLISFVETYLKDRDIKITKEAAKKLVDITQEDFDNVVNELKKLELLDDEITDELIDKVVYDRKGESVFKLIESVFNKDLDSILTLLDKMYEQDIHVFQIINMLINEVSWMLIINKLVEGHTRADSIKLSKLSAWRFNKLSSSSAGYSEEELKDFLDKLIDFEVALKSNNSSELNNVFKAKIVAWT